MKKASYVHDEQWPKWLAVNTNEFMSSEESDKDNAHPLPQRSDYINKVFQKISEYWYCHHKKKMSRQTTDKIKESRMFLKPPKARGCASQPQWAFRK